MSNKFKQLISVILIRLGIILDFMPVEARFALKNKRFWKNKSFIINPISNKYLLVEHNSNVLIMFGVLIFSKIVSNVRGFKIIYLSEAKIPFLYKVLVNSFYKANFKETQTLTSNLNLEIQKEAKELFESLDTIDDILHLYYNKLYIGDIVYDNALREGNWIATIKRLDYRVESVLIKVIATITSLRMLENKYSIDSAIYSHLVGIGGLILRYFTQKKKICYVGIVGAGPIRKQVYQTNQRLKYHGTIEPSHLATILEKHGKEQLLIKADNYLTKRMNAASKQDMDSGLAFSKSKKIYIDEKDFIKDFNLVQGKPIVFVMLHAFNDFPHHYESMLFRDYYEWFIETLKIAQVVDQVNWVFKEHPSAIHYPDDANLDGIFTINEAKHIKFIDRDASLNSASLQHIAHSIVTCIGTAGLEFSCFGIPAIIGGDNHYSEFKIAIKPATKEEYKNQLQKIDKLSKLPKEKTDLAKIIFYIQYGFMSGNTVGNDSFLPSSTHTSRIAMDKEYLLMNILKKMENPKTIDDVHNLEAFILDENRLNYLREDLLIQ